LSLVKTSWENQVDGEVSVRPAGGADQRMKVKLKVTRSQEWEFVLI